MLIRNSKWLPHNSCMGPRTYHAFSFTNLPHLNSSMVRTKVTPRKGERGGKIRVLRMRTVMMMAGKWRRPPPSLVAPPSQAREAPPKAEEILQKIEEVGQLEEVGRSLLSLPTQQLAKMAVEARPSKLGGEEPPHKKLQPTMGGKAPWKEFLQTGKVKKPRRYQLGIVALHEIYGCSKRAQSSWFGNSPSCG